MIRQPPDFTLFPYPPPFRFVEGGAGGHGDGLGREGAAVEVDDAKGADAERAVDLRIAAPPGGVVDEVRLAGSADGRSEEHTSELQSRLHLVCRLLLEKTTNCTPCDSYLALYLNDGPQHQPSARPEFPSLPDRHHCPVADSAYTIRRQHTPLTPRDTSMI